MKTFNIIILAFFITIIGTVNLNAQCTGTSWNFNEDDFMAGSVTANEAAPGAGPTMTDQIDLNADGTNDIQATYEAVVTSPNANGTCDDGDFSITGTWGGIDAAGAGSDFAATSSDDCVCTNGYIIMTVDFINGFNTDVANFEFDWSSQNGSSEGYEYGFGFVSAGTDASGTPLAGLNSIAAVQAAMSTYCNAEYAGGTTISAHALATTTGAFNTQPDALNATVNDCATSAQAGEDTGSGSGPDNSTDNTGAVGLAATDLITQVTYIYGFSNSPGTDCDGDGDTGVGSNPSGSFTGITGCYALPCGYTADVAFTESCGQFTIDLTNIVASGTAAAAGNVEYSLDGGTTWLAYTTGALLPADGSALQVRLVDPSDATCTSEVFNGNAPTGTTPNVPVFIPNNPTITN